MAEEEKDVKEGEETASEEPSTEEKVSADEEDTEEDRGEPLDDPIEDPKDPEEEEEPVKDESEDTPEEKPKEVPAESAEEKLQKLEAHNQNLAKALREERAKKSPLSGTPVDEKKQDPLSVKIVAGYERRAMKDLYAEFPSLDPLNDQDGKVFERFTRAYKVVVADKGDLPVTYEDIFETGREVMTLIDPKQSLKNAETKMKSDNAKEFKKADDAHIPSVKSSKKSEEVSVTEADSRIARKVGMDPQKYTKYKDFFQDEVPV